MILGLNAYAWPWPLGYFAQSVWPNIIASVLWAGPPFVAGTVYGKHRAAKKDAHDRWTAETLAKVHLAATGNPPADHPEHGALT